MGAIRYTQTNTSDSPWEPLQQEQRVSGRSQAQLNAAYAWLDPNGDPMTKGSYRFLHHEIDASSGSAGAANTRACVSAIVQLNSIPVGASTMSHEERQETYQHLAKHLLDAGLKPPAFRTIDPEIDLAPTVERRFTLIPVELRVAENGVNRTITGYAAKFDKLSHNLGGFVERVAPSFFNKARADGWPGVLARYNHKDDFLLGTTASRTLRLSTDKIGLAYEVDPPQSMGYVVELIQRGDVRQSSFAFRAIEDEWTLSESGYPLRTLHSGQIMDVAPVARPAYPDTTAAIRSLADHMGADPQEIQHLAISDELRSLWVQTKGNTSVVKREPKRLFGPAARAALDQRRNGPGE